MAAAVYAVGITPKVVGPLSWLAFLEEFDLMVIIFPLTSGEDCTTWKGTYPETGVRAFCVHGLRLYVSVGAAFLCGRNDPPSLGFS